MAENNRARWFRSFTEMEAETIRHWRRDLHQQPELGFQETNTAAYLAKRLDEMGIVYRTGVGKTGIVATIGTKSSPVVGIRADMDALPIQEENDPAEIPFCSKNAGVMHACGHDTHMAMLLGAAKALLKMQETLPGQIRLIFQPSEERSDDENVHGAERMIQDGALDGLSGIIALHINSMMPAGKVWILPGYAFASGDYWEAEIVGKGGHDSTPHQAIDPVFISAQVINAVYGIRARRLNPTKFGSISIGTIHGGTSGNVIPDVVELSGTIRSLEPELRETMIAELDKAFDVAKALGAEVHFDLKHGVIALYNDPQVSCTFKKAAVDLFGSQALYEQGAMLGVDDFAYMVHQVPGAMAMLGAQIDDQVRPLHNARFAIDESVLPMGAALLAETACQLLEKYAA